MKKINFAVLMTALLAVFTLSSCLEGNNNSTNYGYEYTKVNGGLGFYSFQSPAGYEIFPTNQNEIKKIIDTRYAFIQYMYQTDQVSSGMTRLDAQLMGLMPVHSKRPAPSLTEMEEYANAPIRTISTSGADGFPVQFLWNANTMFVPVYYFIKKFADESEQAAEFNSHDFSVYYDVNEPNVEKGELVLHVRHSVTKPELNKERELMTYSMFHLDLSNAIYDYEAKEGAKPRALIIEYEMSVNGDYNDRKVSEKVVIDYSSILTAFGR